jgi:hypothetical protein
MATMERSRLAILLLTAGSALVFGIFGAQKLVTPELWIGWMPKWIDGLLGFPKDQWMSAIGVSEILMALFLLFPFRRVRQIGAILMCLHLVAIVWSVGWNEIGIRDLGLLAAAAALLVLI